MTADLTQRKPDRLTLIEQRFYGGEGGPSEDVAWLIAEVKNLRRVQERLGVCPECNGSGLGEGEPLPYGDTVAYAPTDCPECCGRACKAAQDAEDRANGYTRLILGAREDETTWDAVSRLKRAAGEHVMGDAT